MKHLHHILLSAVIACAPIGLQAQEGNQTEVPLGLWQTAAGAGGTVFHVRTRRCGRNLCGRVERVKNRRGYDTPSNAVSAMVLRNMRPQPDGSFTGEMRGVGGRSYPVSRLWVLGDRLDVDLCDAKGCRDEVWTRLR